MENMLLQKSLLLQKLLPPMIAALFWLCAVGAVYSYFLYPCVLRVLPRQRLVSVNEPRSLT